MMPTEWLLSYGQSWRQLTYPAFVGVSVSPPGFEFAMSPNSYNLIPLFTTNIGPPTHAPGPLSNNAGVNLPATPSGVTTYATTDQVSIGRCAVLARQLLRARHNQTITPIGESCCAFASTGWTWGTSPAGDHTGLQPGGTSWTNQLKVIDAIKALGTVMKYKVGYTQAYSEPDTAAQKLLDLAAMIQDYDALGLPGVIDHYLELPSDIPSSTTTNLSSLATVTFCRINAPGANGPYSGRVWLTTPMYPWPYRPAGDGHQGDYGVARTGEMEGYIQWLTDDMKTPWTPLWLSMDANPITVSGQVVTVKFDRPAGPDFADGAMSLLSSSSDGGELASCGGFSVYSGTKKLSIANIAISGMTVSLTVIEKLAGSLTVGYAARGPGFPTPSVHSGIWGNLAMVGPASVFFPGQTINAWGIPFSETIMVPTIDVIDTSIHG